MACTRFSLAEAVQRQLGGGSNAAWAKLDELKVAVAQVLNKLLKIDQFTVTMPSGDTVPDGACLARYESVPVAAWKNVSRAKLPGMPIRLPKNMGLWSITPSVHSESTDNPLNSQFIPIPIGFQALLNNQPMISDLLGQVGYEQHGEYAVFTTDITTGPNAQTTVDMEIVVLDMNLYGDYDILPVPADMEFDCIAQVVQLFKGQRPPDKIDDPIANKTYSGGQRA